MSKERPAKTKQTPKQASPMPLKGNVQSSQKQGASNLGSSNVGFGKSQGGKGQKSEQKTRNIESTGSISSISLGQVRFDQNTHLLYVDAKKGGDQIRCSITQDALCGCFDTAPNSDAIQSCFKEHKGEILKALEQKWNAGQWKVPSKEICLEEMDIRRQLKE